MAVKAHRAAAAVVAVGLARGMRAEAVTDVAVEVVVKAAAMEAVVAMEVSLASVERAGRDGEAEDSWAASCRRDISCEAQSLGLQARVAGSA